MAYDRSGQVGALIAERTAYTDQVRVDRLDAAILDLPCLPEGFAGRALTAINAPALDETGYQARGDVLRVLADDLTARLVADGMYGSDPTGEAFMRSYHEPGRAWNMDQWNAQRKRRREQRQ
jgi:hypothetical protein